MQEQIKKFILSPEKIFLLFSLLCGLIFVFLIPPFEAPDEPAHFARTMGIVNGDFLPSKQAQSSGSYLPANYTEMLKVAAQNNSIDFLQFLPQKYSFSKAKKLAQFKDSGPKIFTDYANTARYSPAAYLPQSTGVFISKLFTKTLLYQFLCARIFNILFFVLLGFHTIKSLPFLKWAAILLLLAPMSMSLASSVSADGVLICCSALFFAKILQYSYQDDLSIDTKQTLLLLFLSLLLALTKQSVLLCLFIFLIPAKKFKTFGLTSKILIFIFSIITAAIWSKFALSINVTLNNSDYPSHISYIINHPINFLILTLNYTPFFGNILITKGIIGILGWLNVYFHNIFYSFYMILILLNILYSLNGEYIKFPYLKTLSLLGIIALNYIEICILVFCFWTPKNAFNYIAIPGRYLIPLLLPFLTFCIMLIKPKNTSYKLIIVNIIFLVLSFAYIFLELTKIFYFQ